MITGGASGIGLELTRILIRENVERVVVVGRNEATLAAVAATFPGKITLLPCDLSDHAAVDALLTRLPDIAPTLSILVNNAGSQQITDFAGAMQPALNASLRREIDTNFSSVVALCVGLLPLLARQPTSAIVNITSGLALAPKRSSPVYCATKAGVRSYTRALRYQCEQAMPNVRILEALPPLVDTDMTRGRGSGKISPQQCAEDIIRGLKTGAAEIYVGKSKLLRAIMRLSPALGYRVMRAA